MVTLSHVERFDKWFSNCANEKEEDESDPDLEEQLYSRPPSAFHIIL
jgi:hypothetical protein